MLAQDDGFSLSESFQEGFDSFIGFIPNLIGFLLILVIGWFIARFLASAARRLFAAVNLDHYLDRAGVGAPLERAGYADSGRFVAKLLYYTVMLLVLKVAFDALDIDALNEPFDKLIEWIPKALVALVLIIVGGIVANVVRELVGGITAGQSYGDLVTKIAALSVWLIFGLAALDQAEIASDLVDTLITVIFTSLGAIIVIKFGVGGIWAARDRFWPNVYDSIAGDDKTTAPPAAAPQTPEG